MASETKRVAVRIIRRQQRDLKMQPPSNSSSGAKEGCTDRDLATTVSSWIDDLRQRRQSEAASLFNKLFKEGPAPWCGAAADAAHGR